MRTRVLTRPAGRSSRPSNRSFNRSSNRSTNRPAGIPHHRHSPLRRLARAASWHRRTLAVLAAVATVLTGLAAAAPPAPSTTPVVRARTALAGGVVLSADDLETVELPSEVLPDRWVGDPAALVGRRLAAPLSRHTVVTTAALLAADAAVGVGHVLAPVRLSDADVVGLLSPGDVVDVVTADPDTGKASVVATQVRVATVPAARSDDVGAAAGALVVLDVAEADVEPLAQAVAAGSVTVTWR